MAKFIMGTADDWGEATQRNEYLAEQLLRGRLALLLGAGISKPFNLPIWKGIVNDLYSRKEDTPPEGTLTYQAEIFRHRHYQDDQDGFPKAVGDCLYDDAKISFEALRANATLGAIGSLVMASMRGRAGSVVTFNWDNLLEMYLKYHGVVTASIPWERHWNESVDVCVLHPHGLIEYETRKVLGKLVFDQSSYAIVQEQAWEPTLMSILYRHTCLLIGLGVTDPHLDSLLFKAKNLNASNEHSTLYWAVNFARNPKPEDRKMWHDRGVYCWSVTDFETDLPRVLFDICQRAAGLIKEGRS